MDPTTPLDWHRMFFGVEPPLFLVEIVIRIVAIYLFAAVFMRLMGKRGQRSLSPFETLVIIALGSAVGDGMFYPEVPIVYAWLVIVCVVLLDWLIDALQLRSRWTFLAMSGEPILLVRDGEVVSGGLRAARLRRNELMGLLREQEVANTGEVRYAFLEESGYLGLIRFPDGEAREGEATVPPEI
ncbi:DUF421 domain-containing protein [Rubrivirga marina]|uniref:YetF C-terminal domain-containing protein n=1 Tax=Rubrivirga marina TaxID=1196024 RepID=A0A271IXM7_9BACT|nr:YetF domain-containing protein [Rubrivirga marina]PAP75465.1 hypothetical protein BSZ37_02890 [Rubrivirga marina]